MDVPCQKLGDLDRLLPSVDEDEDRRRRVLFEAVSDWIQKMLRIFGNRLKNVDLAGFSAVHEEKLAVDVLVKVLDS